MADRPLAVADGQSPLQALFDVGAPCVDGAVEALLPGEAGCDRCREAAARSVAVGRVDQLSFEPMRLSVEEQVSAAQLMLATPLDQHGRCALVVQFGSGADGAGLIADVLAAQELGFVAVGRQQGGHWEPLVADRLNRAGLEQYGLGATHQHGINHEGDGPVTEFVCGGLN